MSEGVQTSPEQAGHPRGVSAAIGPLVVGVAAALGGWYSPSGSFAQKALFVCAVGLFIAAVAVLVMRWVIRGPRDYYGGLALLALAVFAIWASGDLPGMHGFAFGPGTGPRIFAFLLGAMAIGTALVGMFTEGPGLATYAFRGPFFITVATLVFAFTIRSFGLVVASMVSIVISAAGSSEIRWLETIIWGAVLTAFCALLFPYGLNLPIPLWPSANISLSTMFSIR